MKEKPADGICKHCGGKIRWCRGIIVRGWYEHYETFSDACDFGDTTAEPVAAVA